MGYLPVMRVIGGILRNKLVADVYRLQGGGGAESRRILSGKLDWRVAGRFVLSLSSCHVRRETNLNLE